MLLGLKVLGLEEWKGSRAVGSMVGGLESFSVCRF